MLIFVTKKANSEEVAANLKKKDFEGICKVYFNSLLKNGIGTVKDSTDWQGNLVCAAKWTTNHDISVNETGAYEQARARKKN